METYRCWGESHLAEVSVRLTLRTNCGSIRFFPHALHSLSLSTGFFQCSDSRGKFAMFSESQSGIIRGLLSFTVATAVDPCSEGCN